MEEKVTINFQNKSEFKTINCQDFNIKNNQLVILDNNNTVFYNFQLKNKRLNPLISITRYRTEYFILKISCPCKNTTLFNKNIDNIDFI